MDAVAWLAAANIVIWIGMGMYLAFIGIKQKQMNRRLDILELLRNDHNK